MARRSAVLCSAVVAAWALTHFVSPIELANVESGTLTAQAWRGVIAVLALMTFSASLMTWWRSTRRVKVSKECTLTVAEIESGGCSVLSEDAWGDPCPLSASFQNMAKTLRSRERYLRTIFESEPECVKTMSADGLLIDMNPAGLSIIEADSLESVKGACVFDLVHEEDRQDFIDMHNRVIGGHSEVLVFRVRGLQGTVSWVETHACPMPTDDGTNLHVAITRNITQACERDEAMAQIRERMDLAVAGSSNGLFDYNPVSAECWFSDRFEELLGFGPGEIAPRFESWEDLLHAEDRLETIRLIHAHLNDQTPLDVECRLRTRDGAYRWFRVKAQAIWNEGGIATRMAGSISDIQAAKESVLELAVAKEQAEAANIAKSEFLANMSHEIRTPMTAILGFADVLLDDDLSAIDREAQLGTIKRNGEQLIAILDDILDLSKIESGRLEIERTQMDLIACVEGVVELMRVRAEEKGLTLRTEWVGRIPGTIRSDPVRLRQILTNLIGNAIKFTASGGVRVICSDEGCEHNEIAITVVDTGIGIEPNRLETIFSPFVQADSSMSRNFGGVGLGLAICASLATELDGTLTVQSIPGQGSSFRFVLAVRECAESPTPDDRDTCDELRVSPDKTTWVAASLQGVRVLLAEDGIDNRRLICHLLQQVEADVTIAEDGEEALRAMAEGEHDFDVVLMDMQMPNLDGYEATRQLRALGVQVPIIAITAHAMVPDRQRCMDAGCSDYLTKPIDRNTFIACCHRWSQKCRAA